MALNLRIRFFGRKEYQARMATAGKRLMSEVERNVAQAAELVIRGAQTSMHGERTRARRKGRPVTSPPKVLGIDSGDLLKSITKLVRRRGRFVYAEVGPQFPVTYGRIHELGGTIHRKPKRRGRRAGARRGSGYAIRIPRRPYLEPGIRKNEGRIFALIGRSFRVV